MISQLNLYLPFANNEEQSLGIYALNLPGMNIRIKLLNLTCIFILCTSCIKKGGSCEEPLDIRSSECIITFRNSSGDYLYKEFNSNYPIDSLKVFDEKGRQFKLLFLKQLITNSNFSYLNVGFGNIFDDQTDQEAFQGALCKKYYIEYKTSDKDSIEICFKARSTNCGSVFDPIKVSTKGRLIYSSSNVSNVYITLIKP